METTLQVGTRVRLRHDVDRYPHFIATAGSTGTVVDVGDTVCVRMDEHLPGAEEWDNEVVWSVTDGDNPLDDVEVMLDLGADRKSPRGEARDGNRQR